MARKREVIEVTAGDVADELKRRGISADERVTITIEAEPEIIPERRESRIRVVAAGLVRAELVLIDERVVACRDATDDKFLELAVNGRAELIVSGDADLLALHPFRAIPIVRPAVFLEHFRS